MDELNTNLDEDIRKVDYKAFEREYKKRGLDQIEDIRELLEYIDYKYKITLALKSHISTIKMYLKDVLKDEQHLEKKVKTEENANENKLKNKSKHNLKLSTGKDLVDFSAKCAHYIIKMIKKIFASKSQNDSFLEIIKVNNALPSQLFVINESYKLLSIVNSYAYRILSFEKGDYSSIDVKTLANQIVQISRIESYNFSSEKDLKIKKSQFDKEFNIAINFVKKDMIKSRTVYSAIMHACIRIINFDKVWRNYLKKNKTVYSNLSQYYSRSNDNEGKKRIQALVHYNLDFSHGKLGRLVKELKEFQDSLRSAENVLENRKIQKEFTHSKLPPSTAALPSQKSKAIVSLNHKPTISVAGDAVESFHSKTIDYLSSEINNMNNFIGDLEHIISSISAVLKEDVKKYSAVELIKRLNKERNKFIDYLKFLKKYLGFTFDELIWIAKELNKVLTQAVSQPASQVNESSSQINTNIGANDINAALPSKAVSQDEFALNDNLNKLRNYVNAMQKTLFFAESRYEQIYDALTRFSEKKDDLRRELYSRL